MQITDFKAISFISFYNSATLDYSNNYFNKISFTYQQNTYTWLVYYNGKDFILEDTYVNDFSIDAKMLTKLKPYTVMRHKDFYFTFIKENGGKYDDDLNLSTIFSKYKLAILSYETAEAINNNTTDSTTNVIASQPNVMINNTTKEGGNGKYSQVIKAI